ncbi:unnamed protein product [Brassicogethes aeneus]|uniref:Ion transport domain-containing protein n=1 Tax=Brassicogethes aeneus TaxID=1431903 RepID=A0A9P0AZC6_BRAAE|nr:unnamed protein product [Brassicogethes aeneus]
MSPLIFNVVLHTFFRTALHLAALKGHADCLKLLLEWGSNIDIWDNNNKVTPLHCAASIGNVCCLRQLILNGANVNAGLNNKSPLHYAVQSRAIECVRELLENRAIPNTTQVFSEAPLHIAASLGASDIIKELIIHEAAVNVQCGTEKVTPLHLAAEDGDFECVRLLLEAGAEVTLCNHKLQTPLHLAALSQCTETMNILIKHGADVNASDIDGRTPLHSSIVKVSRSCEGVRLLVNSGANVNKKDIFGYTPLHLAALNEFSHCIMILINHGGDVTLRTNGGSSVLTFITRKTPDVIPKYISKFDQAIKLNDHEIGDVDCEVKLDFRVLVPTLGQKESDLLLSFVEVGHREVLKHPLCETFLFLKWHKRIRKFFLFSLFFHLMFVTLFTTYIIEVYRCPPKEDPGKSEICKTTSSVIVMGYFLLFLNFLFMCKELFQIAQSWLSYLKRWENWLQWLLIISIFLCVQPKTALIVNISVELDDWQHNVAATGIFFAWVELMMIVGRFPMFGLHVQMFTTVSVNFAKFLLAYFCLFIAFALSFGVLFSNYKSFKDLKLVIIKVIIMMSGELEYEDVFFDDIYPIQYPGTAHLMYLTFVLLVTVILANLMVGLAVSDIQGLQQSAGLDRLVRQAELIGYLESMLFSRLLNFIPYKFMFFLQKQALLLKSQYHWALYIKPNDPREERIPKELIQNIYQLVIEKKEKPKGRRTKNNSHSSYTISPCVSRINSVYGTQTNQKSLKREIEEISKEFQDVFKVLKQKLDKISSQITDSKLK